MENTVIYYLSGKLDKDSVVLRKNQQKNIEHLKSISKKFHDEADLRQCQNSPVSEKLLVLESGHQPNFLPYPGVWKKAFLLHQIKEYLNATGYDAIAIFGFADQNLSTAKLLYENKIPAVNKQGSKKFGIKIPVTEKWKCFNAISKPTKDIWERELDDLKCYYLQYLPRSDTDALPFLNNIDILTEILNTCYSRAANRADLNAFIFARLCQELFNLSVYFFRYSDIQRNKLFLDEGKKILDSLPAFTSVYNDTINKKQLNLPQISSGFFPFWYHCTCGIKVALSADTKSGFKGCCPVCKTEFFLDPVSDNLADHMKNMGLSAVARNIIFSEGLGTRLFISGPGGGLRYGKIANEISRKLLMNIPLTLSWHSRDYYIGVIHKLALKDMLRIFNLTHKDMISGSYNEKITRFRTSLLDQIEILQQNPQKKKELDKYSGLYRSSAKQLMITKKTFSTIPSIIDLLVNFDASIIIHEWNAALNYAEIQDSGEIVLLTKDIIYSHANVPEFTLPDIPRIYHSLDLINEV